MASLDLDNRVRILLVEDQEEVRNLLRMQIEMLCEHKVEDFSDPQHAIDHLKSHPRHYGLIFSDYNMVPKNGVELAQEAELINPEIPVVIITGNIYGLQERYQSLPKNIKSLEQKPVNLEVVKRALSHYACPD